MGQWATGTGRAPYMAGGDRHSAQAPGSLRTPLARCLPLSDVHTDPDQRQGPKVEVPLMVKARSEKPDFIHVLVLIYMYILYM